jgi:hypothetical protein
LKKTYKKTKKKVIIGIKKTKLTKKKKSDKFKYKRMFKTNLIYLFWKKSNKYVEKISNKIINGEFDPGSG